jgi:hypothetical protein
MALVLAILLAAGSGAVWLIWAENAYRGLTSCPWDTPQSGHPWLVGLALSFGSAAIMTWTRRKKSSRAGAAPLGLLTGVLAGLVIAVVALLFGAGLQCTS